MLRQPVRLFRLALVVLAASALPVLADAADPTRYGIEGKFVSYDAARRIIRVLVTSRSAGGFGGSRVGAEAPEDVKPQREMDFAVQPEGSVLSRTVIKSSKGLGLDDSGTAAGFEKAAEAIPRDRTLQLSISPVAAPADGAPAYRVATIIIPLTQAEIEARLKEVLQDD